MGARRYVGLCASAVLAAVGVLAGPLSGVPADAAEAVPLSTGDNTVGQLGTGGSSSRLTPGPVSVPAVEAIASGRDHGYARDALGRVWAWGSNIHGEVGDGTTTNRPTPSVINVTDVVEVESGHYHGIALRSDGTAWTWGFNTLGQLGLGVTGNRRVPTQIPNLTGIAAVAAGRDMSYALRTDGTVLGWGSNALGEVGDGTTTRRLSPVPVSGLTDIVELAGGRNHGLAMTSTGAVWAWGDNTYGQLGDGTTARRLVPVPINLPPVAHIEAGAHHSLAVLRDGRVMTWGRGYRGQLGLGSTTGRLVPTLVPGISNAVEVGDGRDSSFAVTATGNVWAWGANGEGQLGDGTTTQRTSPVPLSVTGIAAAQGGAFHTLFMPIGATGPNQPPTADFTATCSGLTCTFSSSPSGDPDGVVSGWAWDFDDGETSALANPSHTFLAEGTYNVTLTVTDDDDAVSEPTTKPVAVTIPPPVSIAFRAASSSTTNATVARVTAPASVQPGDAMLLFTSVNTQTAVTGPPAGWVLEGERLDGSDLRTRLYSRVAVAGDAGRQFSLTLSAMSKIDLVLLAYSGTNAADPVATLASAAESVSRTTHTTPGVTVPASGGWVVCYWMDKSSATTGWTAPASQTVRRLSLGSGGGRLTSLSTDAGAASAPGAAGGLTATASSPSDKATMWSVVLTS